MNNRIGYLEETGYAAPGNVIRHGDTLRDMKVDGDARYRILGMIGMRDEELPRSAVLSNSAPLAYMVFEKNGSVMLSNVCYGNEKVHVYGLDFSLLDVKQVITLEMYGHTTLSVVTLYDDEEE